MDVVFYLGACTQGKGYIYAIRDVVSTRQKGFCRFWLVVQRFLLVSQNLVSKSPPLRRG